ncbi:MAG: hypothetical protein K2J83_08000 [Clostridia bacterium]|nr:hypothetical protein [Clostridia bacterium]
MIAVCSLFAACKIGGKTWQEILGDAQYQRVTYYAAGGSFGNSKYVKDVYYYPDTPVISDFTIDPVTQTDYVFKGWYYVELDDEGNPKFANEADKARGIPVLTDEAVAFPLTIEKNQHLYFGAKWTRDYKLRYYLIDGSEDITLEVAVEGEEGVTKKVIVSAGGEIAERSFGSQDAITVSYANLPVTVSDATLLEYYVKNENDEYEQFTGSIRKPDVFDETDSDPHVAIYCRFVSGKWEMVRTASEARTMFLNLYSADLDNRNRYYITQDIDCSTNSAVPLKSGLVNSVIQGNGYTISNQKFQTTNPAVMSTYSIFGRITRDAEITGITFEGFEATVSSIRPNIRLYLYLFSADVEEGAVLEDVAFNNSKLTISSLPDDTIIYNIQKDDDGIFNTDTWLFGSGDFSALTYTNAELIINGQSIEVKINEN